MRPTLARLSKASRAPLTGKRGNKDYYKGTRQAFLPGGHRTGAPGKHVVGGSAKYRLLDEKVRVFVAPPVEEIINSPLKPYVSVKVNLSKDEERQAYGRFRTPGGLTPSLFLRVAREKDRVETKMLDTIVRSGEAGKQEGESTRGRALPTWVRLRRKFGAEAEKS